MSVVNGLPLLQAAPMTPMVTEKHVAHGVSYGMSVAGYDIRIRQDVRFNRIGGKIVNHVRDDGEWTLKPGRFVLASTIEAFHMPPDLVGLVKDKSTHARRGLSVFNTVIEPGWIGDELTLELVYHGESELIIPAGSGIAQVIFERIETPARYTGKYQFQSARPVPAIMEKG